MPTQTPEIPSCFSINLHSFFLAFPVTSSTFDPHFKLCIYFIPSTYITIPSTYATTLLLFPLFILIACYLFSAWKHYFALT